MFSADFFAGNRRRLMELLPDGAVFVAAGNGQLQRNGSNTFRFRQDSSFWYLSGLNLPDAAIIISSETAIGLLPERSPSYRLFNGEINADKLKALTGIDNFVESDWQTELNYRIKSKTQLYGLPPLQPYFAEAGFYANPARARLSEIISQPVQDARPLLAGLRKIKSEVEIEAIKRASHISKQVFANIKQGLSRYKSENELMQAVYSAMYAYGADDVAYEPIAAAGASACTLHYQRHNQPLRARQLVLVDAGAEKDFYAADITRTYCTSQPTIRQAAVHQAVLELQNFALSQLKPGRIFKEYDAAVKVCARQMLADLKLKNDDENLKRYFPHSVSHFLGLDVHDAGNYERIEAGMVLTVEPGIYIPEEGIGVRIEDNVVITKNGYDNLTADLTKELY